MARRIRARKQKAPHSPTPRPAQKDGYNTELFPNPRAVRRALKRLGYKISLVNTKVPGAIVRQFQKDFNLCAHAQGWEILKIDHIAGAQTLRALEIALTYAKKIAAQKSVSVNRFWQQRCKSLSPKKAKKDEGKGKFFVELLGNGIGRLRRAEGDLRVRVEELARKGRLLFAKVTIPKQATHDGDRNPRWYPAIARPSQRP